MMSEPTNVKHIIILGPAHPYRGGLAAFNERMAQALQAANYRVTLVTFTLQYPDVLFPGKTQYSGEEAPADLTIHRMINAVNPFNWWKVGRWLRRQQPDLIMTAFWLPFMGPCFGTILRVAKRASVHRIGLIHNLIPHERRPGDQIFSRYFVGANDSFLCLSQQVKEQVQSFAPRKEAQYTPHPIYDHFGERMDKRPAREHLGLPAEGRYLLFFGFIRAYKGLDLLLRAMADERLQAMHVRLVVAGEYYSGAEEYEALIDKLGITDRLNLFTEFIPQEEVPYYFGLADLVVQPYRTATQSGITQMAYHFEKPMIVTRVGGLPEIVPHGRAGYVVETNPQAIADAVIDFYEQEREEELLAGVREEKKRFAWDVLVEVVEDLEKSWKAASKDNQQNKP